MVSSPLGDDEGGEQKHYFPQQVRFSSLGTKNGMGDQWEMGCDFLAWAKQQIESESEKFLGESGQWLLACR
jgi:hypothetical protein